MLLEQPFVKDDKTDDRRSCSASGHDRARSPRSRSAPEAASERRPASRDAEARWQRVVLKLSGEAFAEPSGYGIDAEVVQQHRRARSPTAAPSSASRSRSSSAAATSGAA